MYKGGEVTTQSGRGGLKLCVVVAKEYIFLIP